MPPLVRSTLSDFVRKRQADDVETAATDDEGLETRYRAAMAFERAQADELIDHMTDLREGLQQLKQEGDERHQAVMQVLTALGVDTPESGDTAQAMEAALSRLDRLASRTAGAALRWVWLKALCLTGALWALAGGGAWFLWHSPW